MEDFERAAMFSPMAIVVTGYRNSLLGLGQPSATQILIAGAISAAVFVLGALVFRQTKPAFADVL